MIEIKVNGPNKRTIIDSLRCQLRSQKNRFQLLRFKSLPANVKRSHNNICLDLPQTAKAKRLQQVRSSLPVQLMNKNHSKNYVNQMQPHYRLRYCTQQQSTNNKVRKSQIYRRAKSNIQNHQQQCDGNQQRMKTLPSQAYHHKQQTVNSSLSDYIKRYLSLNYATNDHTNEEIEKMTIQNSEKVARYRKTNKIFKTSNYNPHEIHLEKLFKGKLSPSICNIKKIEQEKTYQLLKKIRIKENIQNSKQGFVKKEGFSKYLVNINKKQSTFKNSFGPWRSSGLSFGI